MPFKFSNIHLLIYLETGGKTQETETKSHPMIQFPNAPTAKVRLMPEPATR